MRARALLTALIVTALAGCGFGYRYNYDASEVYPVVTGSGSLGLAVMDVRPEVLGGSLPADWVGSKGDSAEGGSKVKTRSGAPLATDVQQVVSDGLSHSGFSVTPVEMTLQDLDGIGASLQRSGADRNVLLRIYQWQTRAVSDMVLDYRLALEVFDRSGQRLTLKQMEGRNEKLGAVPLESAEAALAATVMSAKLNEMFNDPRVVAALGEG